MLNDVHKVFQKVPTPIEVVNQLKKRYFLEHIDQQFFKTILWSVKTFIVKILEDTLLYFTLLQATVRGCSRVVTSNKSARLFVIYTLGNFKRIFAV